MIVEVTDSGGNDMDSVHIEDEDEVRVFLDRFVGEPYAAVPSTLQFVAMDGIEHGVEHVLWGVSPGGVVTSWRAVVAA